jgi:hypothetical protein
MDQLVETLIEAKYKIEGCDKNSIMINELNNIIKHFLMVHCQHDIETDHVDITPDTSQTIRYCTKCQHTFDK